MEPSLNRLLRKLFRKRQNDLRGRTRSEFYCLRYNAISPLPSSIISELASFNILPLLFVKVTGSGQQLKTIFRALWNALINASPVQLSGVPLSANMTRFRNIFRSGSRWNRWCDIWIVCSWSIQGLPADSENQHLCGMIPLTEKMWNNVIFLKLYKALHMKESNLCTVILIDKTLTVIIVYRTVDKLRSKLIALFKLILK